MTWWGSDSAGAAEPKRKNRFLLEINGGNQYAVKTVTKPSANVETKEFKMINHVYTYPGIVKWDPITVTFVDGDSDNNASDSSTLKTAKSFYKYLTDSGYVPPNQRSNTEASSPSKAKMNEAFGNHLEIKLLTPDGKKEIENWKLYNPVITKLSWGDLSYEDDGFIEYSMDIKYDYAVLS